MLSKRDQEKEKTRRTILEKSKELFVGKGFLTTSTKELAGAAGVAHGTLFFHFQTKELLILEIIDQELEALTRELHRILHEAAGLEQLLRSYLDFLEGEEDFFAAIAREFPFYSEALQRQITLRQGSIRGYFLMSLEAGSRRGEYKPVDPTAGIAFFFSTLEWLLARRERITGEGSLIRERKDQLIRDFLLLIKK